MKYKKGYLKVHITTVVDIKNKKIIALKVTYDEHVHDDVKVLPKLVEDIKKSKHMTVGRYW